LEISGFGSLSINGAVSEALKPSAKSQGFLLYDRHAGDGDQALSPLPPPSLAHAQRHNRSSIIRRRRRRRRRRRLPLQGICRRSVPNHFCAIIT
jgi:hypothetical protein